MSESRLCIMQVVSNLDIGGAQEVVHTLAENLEKLGCKSIVVTFKDGPLRAGIERLGIPVEILPQRTHDVLSFPGFVRDLWRIRRSLLGLLRKHQVDVVQTHLLRSLDFMILSLRLQTNARVFWTFHNTRFDLRAEHLRRHRWLFKPKLWGYHLLYSLCSRGVDNLIAVSEEVKASIAQTLPAIPQKKIVAISNSVDVSRYAGAKWRSTLRAELGLEDLQQVAALVATFKEQKGHRYLLESLPAVLQQFPGFVLLLIGDGELRDELEAQVQRLELQKHVRFLGQRQDVPELLAASDLFILPSLWEGLPMALIEAMASGLPVIATRVSGTNQVMLHGETGFLVPPGDSDALKEAIVQLLSQPELARRMGAAARQRVEAHFGAQGQAQAHFDLFRSQLHTSV